MGRWQPNARGRLEQAAMELFLEVGYPKPSRARMRSASVIADSSGASEMLGRATRSGIRATEAKAGGALPCELAAMVVLGDQLEVEVLPLTISGFDFQTTSGK